MTFTIDAAAWKAPEAIIKAGHTNGIPERTGWPPDWLLRHGNVMIHKNYYTRKQKEIRERRRELGEELLY